MTSPVLTAPPDGVSLAVSKTANVNWALALGVGLGLATLVSGWAAFHMLASVGKVAGGPDRHSHLTAPPPMEVAASATPYEDSAAAPAPGGEPARIVPLNLSGLSPLAANDIVDASAALAPPPAGHAPGQPGVR